MRFRAAGATALLVVPLDAFVAVFHRSSGATHLLVEPAPQILEALAAPATLATVTELLATRYDLAGDAAELAARIDELLAAGLVEHA